MELFSKLSAIVKDSDELSLSDEETPRKSPAGSMKRKHRKTPSFGALIVNQPSELEYTPNHKDSLEIDTNNFDFFPIPAGEQATTSPDLQYEELRLQLSSLNPQEQAKLLCSLLEAAVFLKRNLSAEDAADGREGIIPAFKYVSKSLKQVGPPCDVFQPLINSGLIDFLLEVISTFVEDRDWEVVSSCMQLLLEIDTKMASLDSKTVTQTWPSSTLQVVVNALAFEGSPSSIQRPGLLLLGNLAGTIDPPMDSIQSLSRYLMNSRDVQIVDAACYALAQLTLSHRWANQMFLAIPHALEALLETLDRFSSCRRLLESVAATLTQICSNVGDEARLKIGATGGVQPLTASLMKHAHDVQLASYLLRALGQLALTKLNYQVLLANEEEYSWGLIIETISMSLPQWKSNAHIHVLAFRVVGAVLVTLLGISSQIYDVSKKHELVHRIMKELFLPNLRDCIETFDVDSISVVVGAIDLWKRTRSVWDFDPPGNIAMVLPELLEIGDWLEISRTKGKKSGDSILALILTCCTDMMSNEAESELAARYLQSLKNVLTGTWSSDALFDAALQATQALQLSFPIALSLYVSVIQQHAQSTLVIEKMIPLFNDLVGSDDRKCIDVAAVITVPIQSMIESHIDNGSIMESIVHLLCRVSDIPAATLHLGLPIADALLALLQHALISDAILISTCINSVIVLDAIASNDYSGTTSSHLVSVEASSIVQDLATQRSKEVPGPLLMKVTDSFVTNLHRRMESKQRLLVRDHLKDSTTSRAVQIAQGAASPRWSRRNSQNELNPEPCSPSVDWDSWLSASLASKELRSHPEVKRLLKLPRKSGDRARLWQHASGADELRARFPTDYYQSLVAIYERHGAPNQEEILKDIRRTLPAHPFFQTDAGIKTLERVLSSYCLRNAETVGYCQSTNLLCGVLLTQMDEESAFWVLCCLIEERVGYYCKSMCSLLVDRRVLNDMVCYYEPELDAFMKDHCVDISSFTTSWFLCLFIDSPFPFEDALVIWDYLLVYGDQVIFLVGLSILSRCKNTILGLETESEVLSYCLHGIRNDLPQIETVLQDLKFVAEDKIVMLRHLHKENVIEEHRRLSTSAIISLEKNWDLDEVVLQELWNKFLQPDPWQVLLHGGHSTVQCFQQAFRDAVFSKEEQEAWLGYGILSGVFERLFKVIDLNSTGLISFEEYLLGVQVFEAEHEEEKITLCFHFLDVDEDGTLTREELSKGLYMIQHMYEEHEAAVTKVDEFVDWIYDYSSSCPISPSMRSRRSSFSIDTETMQTESSRSNSNNTVFLLPPLPPTSTSQDHLNFSEFAHIISYHEASCKFFRIVPKKQRK
jgi:hypothetical protein